MYPSNLKGKLGILWFEFKEFVLNEYVKAKYLGSVLVEPIWDDIFQEYEYSINALYETLEKQGIDFNKERLCLNEEECKEFANAIELADFLKEEIDKYQPTKEENELIEYINFLKEECKSFPFVDCSEIKQKEFKNDEDRKSFLKNMIDRYVSLVPKLQL